MSSPKWEEHNNLYCLIYLLFFLSFCQNSISEPNLRGNNRNFRAFPAVLGKTPQGFFPSSVGKAEKLFFPSFARFARDLTIVVCNVSMFCTYILQLYTQIWENLFVRLSVINKYNMINDYIDRFHTPTHFHSIKNRIDSDVSCKKSNVWWIHTCNRHVTAGGGGGSSTHFF